MRDDMIAYLARHNSIEELAGRLIDNMTQAERRQLERETAQFLKDNAPEARERSRAKALKSSREIAANTKERVEDETAN